MKFVSIAIVAIAVTVGCQNPTGSQPTNGDSLNVLDPYIEKHGEYDYSFVDTNEQVVRYYWSVRVYSHSEGDVDYYYRNLMVATTRTTPVEIYDVNYYNAQPD
jgi:hypothetical protein